MGIQNLLNKLDPIKKQKRIDDYHGEKAAIDAYCWLHKGAYHCAEELVRGTGVDKLVKYCNNRLKMLLDAGITPVIVFDGGRLEAKKHTEEGRAKSRSEKLQKAEHFQLTGQRQKAMQKYSEAVDITPKMARAWITCLRNKNIEYYVAPYEADAQLAYLYHKGIVNVVFTEDSDLLCFGVKKVFYRMDNSGIGYEIDMSHLNQIDSFKDFDFDMFLTTCIISGCDYLPSMKGVGFVKAQKLVEEYTTFKKILKHCKQDPKLEVPNDYKKNYYKALLTFYFQIVFCPIKNELVHLNDVKGHKYEKKFKKFEQKSFLGNFLSPSQAKALAKGDIDPITKEEFKESDFSTVGTEISEINYTQSKLPEIMKQKSQFGNDRKFWSYYNKVKKAEEAAGIIKSKPKKGKKNKKSESEESTIETKLPKKPGRKRKEKEEAKQNDYLMTAFLQDIERGRSFIVDDDPDEDQNDTTGSLNDFYQLNGITSLPKPTQIPQLRLNNDLPRNLNMAVKSGEKVNKKEDDYFAKLKQKGKTIAELARENSNSNDDSGNIKAYSSDQIFRQINRHRQASGNQDPALSNKAKRTKRM